MPTSLFSEIERCTNGGVSNSIEDQRALQLAFELSMLGLEQNTPGCPGTGTNAVPGANTDPDSLQNPPNSVYEEARSKKSQNMTECVPVPSSEHVAEIVGRQGCKIKALRAKTNTYIKTPVRGEEPVFVVTGRKEDVARAKREILSAAEHFSQIRASRKSTLGALLGGAPPGPPATVPGHVTIQVRVPYRVVGLVVGPKGATIKRIQHQTHTYIVTPSRDKEPVFEVTGLPESVEAARREIEGHIALRTGSGLAEEDLLGALCRGGLGSILGCLVPTGTTPCNDSNSNSNDSSVGFSSSGSCSSSSSSTGTTGMHDLVAIWGHGIERDEGLGDSPSFETQGGTSAASIWSFPSVTLPSRPSPPASASPVSPTDSLLGNGSTGGRRECVVCGDKEITAALVPCGHNLFCLDCGNRVCENPNPMCPVCSRPVMQALRIFS